MTNAMKECDIFEERNEIKLAVFVCPHCRRRSEYEVRWLKRTKRKSPPSGISEHDRIRFNKSRDYMVRIDDMLICKNLRCRKRFEIPTMQSVVFL